MNSAYLFWERSKVEKFTEKSIFINKFSFFQGKNAVKISKNTNPPLQRCPLKSTSLWSTFPWIYFKTVWVVYDPLGLCRGRIKWHSDIKILDGNGAYIFLVFVQISVYRWLKISCEVCTVIPRFTGPRFTVSLDKTCLFVLPQYRVL